VATAVPRALVIEIGTQRRAQAAQRLVPPPQGIAHAGDPQPPGGLGARAEAFSKEGKDADARGRRDPRAAGCEGRLLPCGSARSGPDRSHVSSFARVGAALKMRGEDVYVQSQRTWVHLHERGGKRHEMPGHHNLDEYLLAFVEDARLGAAPKGHLFRTAIDRTEQLSERPMSQADVYRMIRRRAEETGIRTGSAVTPSAPRGLRSICATAASWRSRSG
jgi:hypothetical protein